MRTERKGPSPRGWPWSVGDSQKDAPELGLKRDEDGETVRMEGAEPNVSTSHLANLPWGPGVGENTTNGKRLLAAWAPAQK